MADDQTTAAPSDEQLGAALRKIAEMLDLFEYQLHDRIVNAVERIYSDAVDNRGMIPSCDAQPSWDRIIREALSG